jgi:hypothetical protein
VVGACCRRSVAIMGMDEPAELLTLAEVAEELGVTLQRLRRTITRTSTVTSSVTRQTRSGKRDATVLRREEIAKLRDFLSGEEKIPLPAPDAVDVQERVRQPVQEQVRERVESQVHEQVRERVESQVHERDHESVLAGKDALIAALQSDVEYLREALQREQEVSRNLSAVVSAHALADKQSRILEAPHGFTSDTQEGATAPGEPVRGSRPWWKFWGKD